MNPAFRSKRILITGITGFTGKYLSRHLSLMGHHVFGITMGAPMEENHLQCDLCNYSEVVATIKIIQPEFVIHLAGISFVGESNFSNIYDLNVIGTCNLLDALLSLENKPKKVILASSATVYGDQGCEVLDESMCPHPVNHYGCSKLAMEQMALTYKSRLPIIITRPFNYSGVGQESHFLIPKIVSHYREGKKQIELGNLHIEREFNDVDDVCAMYTSFLENDSSGEIVNLCSGRGIALLEVIRMMNEIAGYEIEVFVNPTFVRANEIKRLVGCSVKLETLIGKMPLRSFRKTLETMYSAPK
jgi:nucleoside-diphosphate-sugar epimerase